MARYYCDYCDIYLTHDSLAVRRAHNAGWKHQAQVKAHYAEIAKNYTQFAIDQLTRSQMPPMFGPPPFARPQMPPATTPRP